MTQQTTAQRDRMEIELLVSDCRDDGMEWNTFRHELMCAFERNYPEYNFPNMPTREMGHAIERAVYHGVIRIAPNCRMQLMVYRN